MSYKYFRQRIKNNEHVGIHVTSKQNALYVEKILNKYGFSWNTSIKYVEQLMSHGMTEVVIDINYLGKYLLFSRQPNNTIHKDYNLIYFSSKNIKNVKYLFNDNFSIKPTYKPKKIERTI